MKSVLCWLLCAFCLLASVSTRSVREVKEEVEAVTKTECEPVTCGPSCPEALDQFGCPTCLCGPACAPPKCDPGCRVHFDSALGPCPGCVCDEDASQNISVYALPHEVPSPKCQCDWRYLKHYETKKCTPVLKEGCDCPLRFDCPQLLNTSDNVCEYKGKTYELGDAINTSSTCEICSCGRSYTGSAQVSCIPIECPSLFGPPPAEGCYEVYEADKCCSVETKCPGAEGEEQGNVTEPTCEYGGRSYHLGERIYPEEDPCMSCLCDENWTGVNSNSCHVHECFLERNLVQLRRGCVPIYHEKTCCPIEFHCGHESEENLNDTLTARSEGGCIFGGKSYSVGEQLDIHHPTNCVTCSCTIPPDFTCVHISCPPPPNGDYINCRSNYHEGVCCPTYDCGEHEHSAPLACEPLECRDGCKEAIGPDGCTLCLCGQVLCTPPRCPETCEVEYDVPQGSCPRCKCPSTLLYAPVQCAPVKCDPQCFEAVGPEGCGTCICGPLCLPPKCDEGCTLQTDLPPGQCPGCVCSSSSGSELIQCGEVKCGAGCREAQSHFGCPTCLCGPLCSPPKCDPGCEVEVVPSSGPCPGCVCRDQLTHNVQCAPVKCSPGCREATGQFGCPTCLCDPLCSPPKCDPGCEVELIPSSGPCPGCVCKDDEGAGIQCAPVKCAPTCREAIGQFGCPTCLCDPLCSPPKCGPGCEVESVPSSGPCPGCVCSGVRETADIQCAPPNCDPTCHEVIGDSGCPVCACEPLCSPPKCDPGCDIEAVPSSGPCPGCVCGDEKKGRQVQCAPVKCGHQCREAVGQFGCPMCLCDPLCSPPKCDAGCEIETVPSSGPCPGCVCKEQAEAKVQCAPVKCAPLCREAVGQYGCPTCICDPACSPPQCNPGCKVEVVPSLGPCPGCVCDGDDTKDQSRSKRDVWNNFYADVEK